MARRNEITIMNTQDIPTMPFVFSIYAEYQNITYHQQEFKWCQNTEDAHNTAKKTLETICPESKGWTKHHVSIYNLTEQMKEVAASALEILEEELRGIATWN